MLDRAVEPGERVILSAAGSRDRDGDAMSFRWWLYPELSDAAWKLSPIEDGILVQVRVPNTARNGQTHLILEVTDAGTPPLTSYRRIIFNVR